MWYSSEIESMHNGEGSLLNNNGREGDSMEDDSDRVCQVYHVKVKTGHTLSPLSSISDRWTMMAWDLTGAYATTDLLSFL